MNDPYEQGYEAYHNMIPLRECPYEEGSEDAIDWEGGWMNAEELDGE